MKGAKTLHHALEQAGIEHTFLETEGAHHWRVWRRYLRDLAPLLFSKPQRVWADRLRATAVHWAIACCSLEWSNGKKGGT